MEEMVEPDRTILIVSIIGLVVIWGSFFYHKFVQQGGQEREEVEPRPAVEREPTAADLAEAAAAATASDKSSKSGKRKGRKKR